MNNNQYIVEMLQIVNGSENMEGYDEAIKLATSFNVPCEEFSLKVSEGVTTIEAGNENSNVSLLIVIDQTKNAIKTVPLYKSEDKRATL